MEAVDEAERRELKRRMRAACIPENFSCWGAIRISQRPLEISHAGRVGLDYTYPGLAKAQRVSTGGKRGNLVVGSKVGSRVL